MGIPPSMKFATITGNGQSAAIVWPGGRGVFIAYGTFGSGTYALQASYDDGVTWVGVDKSPDTYCTLTNAGSGGFELPQCMLRVNTTGSTTPSVTAGLQTTARAY